ncbi:MAG TPA: ATP-binding cassette domain-containing protein [Polyangiales bacterium]|nr:ATP-binding cassette domain-containing protein [Polyangiales bacterium]
MTTANLLHAHGLVVQTPGGRPLFRDLTMILNRGDRVALVGRNGAGKSTLLEVLAGHSAADGGNLACYGERAFVPQSIEPDPAASPGEARRRRLQQALDTGADLLLLDEPTQDLDHASALWLADALQRWPDGLVVVSHDRRLLAEFYDFFVVAESGCHHFSGSCGELISALEQERAENERRYVSNLERLTAHEKRQFLVRQRRERKKNVGRIRELGRATPKIILNYKRSYAQEKQAKRNLIQRDRVESARAWAEATRRALAVDLPLATLLPALPEPSAIPLARLQHVTACIGERVIIDDLTLDLDRQRIAVRGPNGSGKSLLLELLAGTRPPDRGHASIEPHRIGYIAQNAANWRKDESLLQHLVYACHHTADAAASCIHSHRFPFALAERPLASLSPGERLRAALICLLHRPSAPELLILDEPTNHLDFIGYDTLKELLSHWKGGLVVASHDEDFVHGLGLEMRITLDDRASA